MGGVDLGERGYTKGMKEMQSYMSPKAHGNLESALPECLWKVQYFKECHESRGLAQISIPIANLFLKIPIKSVKCYSAEETFPALL